MYSLGESCAALLGAEPEEAASQEPARPRHQGYPNIRSSQWLAARPSSSLPSSQPLLLQSLLMLLSCGLSGAAGTRPLQGIPTARERAVRHFGGPNKRRCPARSQPDCCCWKQEVFLCKIIPPASVCASRPRCQQVANEGRR